MDTYGTDAVRFTLARGANPGTDVPVGEEWVQGSRNFCNKIWNATRFALMNGATVAAEVPPAAELATTDRWILSRLSAVTAEVDGYYEDYQFARVSDTLFHFAWDEVFDWYVELSKPVLAAGGARADATRAVLGHVLDVTLRLLHPIVPFVTEELWTTLTGGESVVVAPWPVADPARRDLAAEAEIADLRRLVTEVRRFRSDQGLKPTQKVSAALAGIEKTRLAEHEAAARALLRLTPPGEAFAPTASLSVLDITVELDLAGAIDVAAERRRLEKDLAAARKEAGQMSGKLANEGFMAKAPDAVVTKTRERLGIAESEIVRLEAQLAALPSG
jgi:valyl-tRNA synthetase